MLYLPPEFAGFFLTDAQHCVDAGHHAITPFVVFVYSVPKTWPHLICDVGLGEGKY